MTDRDKYIACFVNTFLSRWKLNLQIHLGQEYVDHASSHTRLLAQTLAETAWEITVNEK